jgi:hypothetical protein
VDYAIPGEDLWDCEAYGSAGSKLGLLCFFSQNEWMRECPSRGDCHDVMNDERRKLYHYLTEKRAEGDSTAAYVLQCFPNPEELLQAADTEAGRARGNARYVTELEAHRARRTPNP